MSKNKPIISITDKSAFFKANGPSFSSSTQNKPRPFFSFRHICQKDFCMKKCSIEQFRKISERLRILCSLTWEEIGVSPKEQYGCEPIPQSAIRASLPDIVDPDEPIGVFRFGSGRNGGRIAGVRRGENFYILFIDSKYNLYDHGS